MINYLFEFVGYFQSYLKDAKNSLLFLLVLYYKVEFESVLPKLLEF